MAEQPLFWVVVRDGAGKWVVYYDPRGHMKDCQRFAYEARAIEYQKKKIKIDAEARKALAAKQEDLL